MALDMREALVEVIGSTLERQAFLFGDETPKESMDSPEGGLLQAVIGWTGQAEGSLQLVTTEVLARELAANVLGMEPGDELDDDGVRDALGETLNVACGQLLTEVYGTEPVFRLSMPQVGPTPDAEWKAILADPASIGLDVEGSPLLALAAASEGRPAARPL